MSFSRIFNPIAITISIALAGIVISLGITERAIEESGHEISRHSLSRHLENLQDFQELLLLDYTEWGSAFEHMSQQRDMDWFYNHIGTADVINTTIHGMGFMSNSGELIVQFVRDNNPDYKLSSPAFNGHFSHIRNEILKQDASKPFPYSFYQTINGIPALVTLSPLTLVEPGEHSDYVAEKRDFMIFWRLLPPEFKQDVSRSLKLKQLTFTPDDNPENLPLKNSMGENIGALSWQRMAEKKNPLALSLYTSFAMFALLLIGGYMSYRRVIELLNEMNDAKSKAEHGHKIKSDFLATMSHELRTPLNAIIGFSDILTTRKEDPLSPQQSEYLEHIQTSGAHLLTIVNEILDLSKIEAGRYDLREEELDVTRLLKKCLVFVQKNAQDKKLDVTTRFPEVAQEIRGDEKVLKQLILNLLSNAMKFTPEKGTVAIRYRVTKNQELHITIKDTGIGISPEKLEIITEPYLQDQDHKTRSHEGTGLGLAISKAFIELHQGQMIIESELNKGTTVTLIFPPERLIV
ncbi:ATP-binding protein [Paremcibacter congregatus]|uniref:sensor histidine kinase n=1 Tax=Paremcibacter congregatus TaxID=2043170 RepID=UPI0030EC921D